MKLDELTTTERVRRREFPVTSEQVFLAHAAVSPIPRVAVQAIREFTERSSRGAQSVECAVEKVGEARETAARLLGCDPGEIALLGPTSLGLSLVANGLPWKPGDEVIYYPDDYPANVYPWTQLRDHGVKVVPLRPEHPGKITWDLVQAAITERTKLVALASCSFLSGYRIDVESIGRPLHDRDILFAVDGIQSLGAFPLSVEHVDFLSADSHKWMLGFEGAGIFYVKASRHDLLRPTLLGCANVISPDFIAQDELRYCRGAQRYEPGTLNLMGILGMAASLELLLGIGIEPIAQRILELRRAFLDAIRPLGYRLYIEQCDLDPAATDADRSGIITVTHPDRDLRELADRLEAAKVIASLRQNRAGEPLLRFSPHFYNTHAELDRVVALLK